MLTPQDVEHAGPIDPSNSFEREHTGVEALSCAEYLKET